MDEKKPKSKIRGVLPWLISAVLLGYVLWTNDLEAVVASFAQAQYIRFIFWMFVFVVFWLFFQSLIFYLCLRWFVSAESPYVDYEPGATEVRFGYRGIVRAAAAVYILKIVNIVVGAGGMVVYLNRRFGVPYKRGVAALLMGLQNVFVSMGIVAYVTAKLLPPELIPVHAQDQIELAGVVGLSGMGFYLIAFSASMIARVIPGFKDQDHLFTPFIWCKVYAYPALLLLALVQMLSYGLFVIITMPCFDLHPPPLATMALTQVVTLARGLPISAQGIGLDQVTFPFLFQGWGAASVIVAFSICYTFSKILIRFAIGVPFFTRATREMFEREEIIE